MSPINSNTVIAFFLFAFYFTLRLVSSPLLETFSSSIIFGLSLIVGLKVAGEGTWSGSIKWFNTHRLTSILVVLAAVVVGILAILRGDRSGVQAILDFIMAAMLFWAFASVYTRVESRWLR